jgi:hypothetical protein
MRGSAHQPAVGDGEHDLARRGSRARSRPRAWSRRPRWGSRRAAIAFRGDRKRHGRTMADQESCDGSIVASTWGFPQFSPHLQRHELHRRNSSWDLTRKRTEVQLLPRPPYML